MVAILRSISLAALVALAAFPALAQQARQAQAPARPPAAAAPSQPDNTTATFGDWVHRCQQTANGRTCEIAQALHVQGQQGPVALIAIGRPVKGEAIRIVVQVPPNLAFGAPLRVALGEKDEGLQTNWQRCIPGGCFADAAMTEDFLKRWRAFAEAGQLRYTDAANRPIALGFSLRGFSAAADALGRE